MRLRGTLIALFALTTLASAQSPEPACSRLNDVKVYPGDARSCGRREGVAREKCTAWLGARTLCRQIYLGCTEPEGFGTKPTMPCVDCRARFDRCMRIRHLLIMHKYGR
jgi:hypothetical protein